MLAANLPHQRPVGAKLMILTKSGKIQHDLRSNFINYLHSGDLVIANDAAVMPASLKGIHSRTRSEIEIRLAGTRSLQPVNSPEFTAVVFGVGDYHTRTEDRPLPPALKRGDRLQLGGVSAVVLDIMDHPRLIAIRFEGSPVEIWAVLSRWGRPIQYSHIPNDLQMWDVWTSIANKPVAFEPPSAGFILNWSIIRQIHSNGIRFASITHAAGISSTGDPELDQRLPFDEPYRISTKTAQMIEQTRSRGGQIIAIGTTVVRCLEHASEKDEIIRAGEAIATNRIGPNTRLKIVDAILSGTHEPDTSHYQMLRAFVEDDFLLMGSQELNDHSYRTHEFGDSVLIERSRVDYKEQHSKYSKSYGDVTAVQNQVRVG